jgi:hypothetical protein
VERAVKRRKVVSSYAMEWFAKTGKLPHSPKLLLTDDFAKTNIHRFSPNSWGGVDEDQFCAIGESVKKL